MIAWRRAAGFGFLMWLVPFLIAFVTFPLHESQRPLFESIMAVTVTATAVVLGLRYQWPGGGAARGAGLRAGLFWLIICVAIDAPLMLLGGPMQMTPQEYLADIGLTYVSIPVVTWGLVRAAARGRMSPTT